MSDIEKDTPVGVEEEPAERSDQDRELAERLVEQAKDEGRPIAQVARELGIAESGAASLAQARRCRRWPS